MSRSRNNSVGISSGSMADIAFLLLTFYMMTTTLSDQKGLTLLLPLLQDETPFIPVKERNLFKIQVNSFDKLLVNSESRNSLIGLRNEIKTFITNNGQRQNLSESPKKAVVSIKTDRGTSYKQYILILDEVQAAYYEIYGERVGLSSQEFRSLDLTVPANRHLYEKSRAGIPMNISIAEPTN